MTKRRIHRTDLAPQLSGASSSVPLNEVMKKLQAPGAGFEMVQYIPGSTYKDSSTVIVIPTRGPTKKTCPGCKALNEPDAAHCKKCGVEIPADVAARATGAPPGISQQVVERWMGLIAPMNQKRAMLFASGHEVGRAYDAMIAQILGHPELKKWRYVMTLEDDNIPPVDAHIRLLESIEAGGFDAVSGLYFTKGSINMPMAYGDPDEFARTGILDFRPRDVRSALAAGQIMRVNGIAMGCALWRMDLFRELVPPWYVTVNDVVPGKGVQGFTQDLYFCERACRSGKRFAVDMRVRVGHMDVSTGRIY